jgi:hypothetical protein
MELDVLYAHIASLPVVAGLPALAQRIAHKELPHGADIIVGIHTRLLKERHHLQSASTPSVPPPLSSPPSSFPPPHPSVSFGLPPPADTIETEFTELDPLDEPAPASFGQWGAWGLRKPSGSSDLDGLDEPAPASFGQWGAWELGKLSGSSDLDSVEVLQQPTKEGPTKGKLKGKKGKGPPVSVA